MHRQKSRFYARPPRHTGTGFRQTAAPGGIRHGVGVNGWMGCPAGTTLKKNGRRKPEANTNTALAQFLRGMAAARGNAGQEQNIQPGQALPFIKLARYALEEIGNQAGCRVGKARRQVDGIRHIQRSGAPPPSWGARPQAVNSSHWVNMGCCKANSTHKKQLPPTNSKKPGLNSARRIARHPARTPK